MKCPACHADLEFEEGESIATCPNCQSCEGCGTWFHPAGVDLPGGTSDRDGGGRCRGCLCWYCEECDIAGHMLECPEYRIWRGEDDDSPAFREREERERERPQWRPGDGKA